MQADIFDQITEPSKKDIFDQVSGDIFDKISQTKLPEGLEYNPKTGKVEEKGLETPGIVGTLLNPAEWVGMGATGAIVAKRLGQPILKTAVDWAAQGIPSLVKGGIGLVKGISAGLKAPGIERLMPVEKVAPITMEEASQISKIPVVSTIEKRIAPEVKVGVKPIEIKWVEDPIGDNMFVAYDGTKEVGWYQVNPSKTGGFRGVTISVHPDYKGRGIGTELVKRAKEKFGERLGGTEPTQAGKGFLEAIGEVPGEKFLEQLKAKSKVKVEGIKQPSLESLEATVKGGQVAPLSKYAEKSSINLERLETTDDVKHFINDLTIEQETKIGKRRIGWEETRQKAEELGWNIDEVKIAFQRKKAFTAAEIEATRQVNINAITDLHTMLKTLPAERTAYTPEMRAKLLDALDSVRITSQVSSEAGRALNIHKKILARNEQFKEISQMNRVLKVLEGKGIKRTDDVIDTLKTINFNNPAEVNRFVYNTTKTKYQKLSDVAYEIWINGLLSNPLTHIVNTTSNTLTLMGQYPERLLGAGIEKVRAGFGVFGGKTQERFIGETAQDAFSVIQGLKNGIKRFFNTMKTGRMTETKLETHVSALAPTVQKFMPARALGAEDELFKGFIQNSELNRLAYRKASQEGLKGKIKADRIVDLLSNPTEEMLEMAAHQAKYLTYQQELGKVGSWIMRGRDTVPGLKYFIPFVRTPANIIKYALERTPANIPRIVYKTVKGELSGGQLSEDMAKVLTGSMVGFGSYLMAKEGYITGGGPKNPAERDELFRIGWLPYALHIGDKYYSLARLEPLASILGISADFAELEKHMKEDEKINVASAIGSSISKNFTSKTFMQGFSNVNDAISDPGRFGEKFVQNLGGSIIPAVLGGVTRAIDPKIREVKGILDTVRSRIPGLSTGLPTKIDVWGDPIERPSAPLPRFLSPVQVSQAKGDPIDIELTNLKLNLGMPPKKIKGIELEPNEYRQMVIDAGKIAKPELNKLIQESWYKRLTNEEKEKEIRKIMRDARDDARDDALIKVEKRLAMKGKD